VSASPYLILVSLDGSRVPLLDPTTFGRASDNAVALRDASVSSHHAAIRRDGAFWVVEDLGSTNGTWLNHKRVDGRAVIKEGDQIQMGSQMIHVGGFRSSGDRRTSVVAAACPRCEKALPEGAAYCPFCGVALGAAPIPPLPSQGIAGSGSQLVPTAPFEIPYPSGIPGSALDHPKKGPNWVLIGCLIVAGLLALSLFGGWLIWDKLLGGRI